MAREVLNVFLINYSMIITFQILSKIWENNKLKEENNLLKDNIRIKEKRKEFTFNSQIESDSGVEQIKSEIEKYFKNAGTNKNFI
jgi:hypothetical protein|nr:MAG TPA: hypothetical protein [Caudoviricetes sp.]